MQMFAKQLKAALVNICIFEMIKITMCHVKCVTHSGEARAVIASYCFDLVKAVKNRPVHRGGLF